MNAKDEALKMAIEALELWHGRYISMTCIAAELDFKEIINACKEALASHSEALEQPVSLGDFDKISKEQCVDYIEHLRKEIGLLLDDLKNCNERINELEAQLPQIGDAEIRQMLNDIEYYQKRVEELEQPAQPLSDDEIKALAEQLKQSVFGFPENIIWLARAIEQAHGIRVKDGQTI